MTNSSSSAVFARDGFVVVKDWVPANLIQNARFEFSSITVGSSNERPIEEDELANLPYGKALQAYAMQFAQYILQLTVLPTVVQNQVVLKPHRSPVQEDHIDGPRLIRTVFDNDFSQMPIIDFIVGIPLIDVSTKDHGNLRVYPGTHKLVARYIAHEWSNLMGRNHGSEALLRTSGAISPLLSDFTPDFAITTIGDIYMMHGLMPHGTVLNNGPDRPVWYFRGRTQAKRGLDAIKEIFI